MGPGQYVLVLLLFFSSIREVIWQVMCRHAEKNVS